MQAVSWVNPWQLCGWLHGVWNNTPRSSRALGSTPVITALSTGYCSIRMPAHRLLHPAQRAVAQRLRALARCCRPNTRGSILLRAYLRPTCNHHCRPILRETGRRPPRDRHAAADDTRSGIAIDEGRRRQQLPSNRTRPPQAPTFGRHPKPVTKPPSGRPCPRCMLITRKRSVRNGR
jgi:hypothetical protein